MSAPQARLSVFDGCIGMACPYCGRLIPSDGVRFRPAFDPGEGVPLASEVSWEARCPSCHGDFSVGGGRSPSENTPHPPNPRCTADGHLLRLMGDLESLEDVVAELRTATGGPLPPISNPPIWRGRA